MASTAIDWMRAELTARVAAIDATADLTHTADLAREIDRVRRSAQDYGFTPAVAVARAAGHALGAGAAKPVVHAWLAALGEALGCDSEEAGETIAAATALRFR